MADGKGNNWTMVLVALITAGATVLAALISGVFRGQPGGAPPGGSTPSGGPTRAAVAEDPDDEDDPDDAWDFAPNRASFASLSGTPSFPAMSADPLRDGWGNTIAGLNHTNLGAAFGMYVDRLDLQFDGYAELQREDRNADGFFELYRVDVNVDNLTDYYFEVSPFNGMVQPVPPR